MDQRLLQIAKCYESETNPRGTNFEDASFKELVASIKEKGVIQPVLARPRKKGSKEFEVVAGNRRLRASALAGLTEIPALVKEMTDLEVREAQIIENLQRADIPPLEEGLSYRALIESAGKSKYTTADLAIAVGKSETFIRQRLALTNLIPKAQKALRSGEMSLTNAVILARCDAKLQAECFNRAINWDAEELRDHIQSVAFKALAGKPWAKDAKLTELLGDTDKPSLFGDAKTVDPVAAGQRMAAYIEIKIREAEAKGRKLLRISTTYGTPEIKGTLGRSEYRIVKAGDKDVTDDLYGIVVAGDDMGRVHRITTAKEALRDSSNYKPTAKELAARKAANKRELEARKKRDADNKEAFDKAMAKLKWPLSEKHVSALFDFALYRCGGSYQQPVCKLFGLEAVKVVTKGYGSHRSYDATLRKFVGDDTTKKVQVIFALLMPHPNPGYPDFANAEKKI